MKPREPRPVAEKRRQTDQPKLQDRKGQCAAEQAGVDEEGRGMVDAQPQRRDGQQLTVAAAHPAKCKQNEAHCEKCGRKRRAPGNLLDREADERRQGRVGTEQPEAEVVSDPHGREVRQTSIDHGKGEDGRCHLGNMKRQHDCPPRKLRTWDALSFSR